MLLTLNIGIVLNNILKNSFVNFSGSVGIKNQKEGQNEIYVENLFSVMGLIG